MNFKVRRSVLLLALLSIVSLAVLNGCGGSDTTTTTTTTTQSTKTVIVIGTVSSSASEAPALGGRNYSLTNQFTADVVDKFNPSVSLGTVTLSGTNTFKATLPMVTSNKYATVRLREITSGKVVMSALLGRVPKTTETTANTLSIKGVKLDEESTAKDLMMTANNKFEDVPDVPIATDVNDDADYSGVDSPFDTACESSITDYQTKADEIKKAVKVIVDVMKNPGISAEIKNKISSVDNIMELLEDFSTIAKESGGNQALGRIVETKSITIDGKTVDANTSNFSDIVKEVTNDIKVMEKAATPTFSQAAGTYVASVGIVLTTATSGASIYYTTDGSVPTTSSTKYTAGATIEITASKTVKAIASKTGFINSETASASYVIKAASPTFSLAQDSYTETQQVALTAAEGATIYYTTDSSVPTTSSQAYVSGKPIVLTTTTTIKAIAVKTGLENSDVAKITYSIVLPVVNQVAKPDFDPNAGSYSVTKEISITCATEGASIYYTIDGSKPSAASTAYQTGGKVTISSTTTLKVIAVKNGMTDSEIASGIFIISTQTPTKVATPAFGPAPTTSSAAVQVEITCETPDAAIYYTIDGSEPTTASTRYAGQKIAVSATTTIKAIAVKTGLTNSDVATGVYTIQSQAVAELTFASFAKKALLVVNVSGTDGATTEETPGTLPANSPAAAPKEVLRFASPLPSYIKDRFDLNNSNSFPMRSPFEARRAITENDATYTFKVSGLSGETTTNMVANKVYGTATSKCLIFLQNGISATTDWNKVGTYFDESIYAKMLDAYGAPTDIDNNGKVVILYYDMGIKEKTTMGYFSSGDLIAGSGNDMEVFYMNIKWGIDAGSTDVTDPLDGEMVRTLSHEFQHMINYGQRVAINKLPGMDSWMDEGLAEAAEQYISGTPGQGRIDTFKADQKNLLKNGASLCTWGQNDESYALSYTFIEYCKNQATDREKIFKEIYKSPYGDFRAIESVMKAKNTSFTSFKDIMVGYRIANLVNGDGIYGYGTEKTTFNFGALLPPTNALDTIKLKSGSAIYIYPTASDLTNFTPAGQGANIYFVKINK